MFLKMGIRRLSIDLSRSTGYIFLAFVRIKKMFGNIGFPELLIILALALLVFGPKKLPEVGRSLGRALREFRRTSDEIKEKLEEEIHAEEFREIKDEIKKDFKEDEEGKKNS